MTRPATDPPAAGTLRVRSIRRLTPDQVAAVTALVDDTTDADGVRPLSEHVMLHLRYGGDHQSRNLLGFAGAELVGYAHLDLVTDATVSNTDGTTGGTTASTTDGSDPVEEPSAELAVHPDARRRGYGRQLVEAALRQTGGRLRLWAHGDLPAAGAMADRLGFARIRSLWQMRRSLAQPLPRPQLPEGITVRTFRPGADEQAWLSLNARAFAHHPEQGSWTAEDLRHRMQQSWFDPEGFFLAERAAEPDRLVGFHWTKVHGARAHDRRPADHSHDHGRGHDPGHGHGPIGEVYVVGVDPAAAGAGLGRALTVIGLRHLRAAGLQDVLLYVDESNRAAIRLYQSLGFVRWSTDVLFRRGPG